MPNQSSSATEFTEYYEKHKNAIFSYILYRVSFNRETAEDLTSEIFVKAYSAFDRYDRSRPFKTWIFTIAHNHLVNYYTSRKETLALDEAVEVVKEAPHCESLDQQMVVARLLSLVSGLAQSQRDLVIMRFVNDMSNSEIAAITGKEEGAVRTALSRAIATLRDLYNQSPQYGPRGPNLT